MSSRAAVGLFPVVVAVGLPVACLLAGVTGCGSSTRDPAGSGGSGGMASGGTGGGGGAPRFTLTSSAFASGGDIPAAYTCAGDDSSPPLAWMNPPAGTASFALTITDLTPTIPVTQWVIWNIPASASSLPAGVPEDVAILLPPLTGQQASSKTGSVGYNGPCPGGADHQYQFRVFALDVASIAGITETSTVREVVDVILDHIIEFADTVGRSDASAP